MYSLREAEDLVLANCRYPDDQSMRVRARNWLQEAYYEITGSVVIPSLEDTFAFSLAQGEYTKRMPVDTAGVINVRVMSKDGDATLNWSLDDWNPDELDWEEPNIAGSQQGDPEEYRIQSINGIRNEDPQVADYYVKSSHGADMVNVSVILYLDSDLQKTQHFTVKLDGTTRVFIGRGYKAIASSKQGQTQGTITLQKRVASFSSTTPTPPPPIPVAGVILPVGAETAAQNGTSETLAISKPAGTTDGDFMILAVATDAAGFADFITCQVFMESMTISNGGWQKIPGIRPGGVPAVPGEVTTEYWYKVAVSEPASYTLTFAESINSAAILSVWRGVDNSDPFNFGFHSQLSAAASGVTPPTGAYPAVANEVFLGHWATKNDVVITEPTGYTETAEIKSDAGGGNVIALESHYEVGATDGLPDTGTHTGGASTTWGISMLALEPGTTAVTPPAAPPATISQWLTIAEIAPQDAEPQTFTLEVRPICQTAFTFESRFVRKGPRLINDSDTFFFIPGNYHQMIVEGAIKRGEKFIEDKRLVVSASEYNRMWSNFIKQFKPLRVRKIGFTFDTG
jgi:hypothetical protein